ncbi:MAG: glycosyltransferase family 4 protein [Minisyncoccia bacterium]
MPGSIGHPMGGMNTIYRFARFMREQKEVKNNFIVTGAAHQERSEILKYVSQKVPDVSIENIFQVRTKKDLYDLPDSDAVIATRWDTALYALHVDKTCAKFYFLQDFEPMFSPAGIASALAEATYRFGFIGIVNSKGLYEIYKQYTPHSTYFTPGVDKEIYYPAVIEPQKHTVSRPISIIFYGRPGIPRNGFELGIEALKRIKQMHGDAVKIYSAGRSWDEEKYGVKGIIKNVGMLSDLHAVAELYRKSDIGLVFVFTRGPSYQGIEFMASGTAVVTNFNPSGTWLLKDKENCLFAEPTVSDVTDKIDRLVKSETLRKNLAQNGIRTARTLEWNREWEKIWQFIADKTTSTP